MYIIKNAIKNLGRNKGRNILMGILTFFMLAVVCVSVVIESASQKISEAYKNRFSVTANLSVDYMSLIAGSSNGVLDIPSLTQEDFAKYAESKYVDDCITFGSTVVYAPEVIAIGADQISNGIGMQIMEPDGFSSQFYSANLSFYGYSDLMLLTDFIEGNRKFISGSVFANINECVISSELAEQNDLSVGDTIEVHTAKKANSQTLNLTISGIYLDAIPNSDANIFDVTQNRRNDVMVSFETLSQLNSDKYNIDGTFILSDPNAIDAFTLELHQKGLPEAYYVSSNVDDYKQVAAPAESLSNIVQVFMVVVLVLGGSILLFLSLITIRERKYEIGILRAKGMSKGKIAVQFLTENFALILTCLILAMSVGIIVAQPVSDMLLKQQTEKFEEQRETQVDIYQDIFASDDSQNKAFGSNANDLNPITNIPVALNVKDVLFISLLSIALCILTSIVGVIYISKHEPMKILMERS